MLNFERIKFGGVRHSKLLYNMLDLELLSKLEVPEPTREDIEILKAVLAVLAALASSEVGDWAGAVRRRFKPLLKTNKDELGGLLEILTLAGVCRLEDRWEDGDYDEERAQSLFGAYLG